MSEKSRTRIAKRPSARFASRSRVRGDSGQNRAKCRVTMAAVVAENARKPVRTRARAVVTVGGAVAAWQAANQDQESRVRVVP